MGYTFVGSKHVEISTISHIRYKPSEINRIIDTYIEVNNLQCIKLLRTCRINFIREAVDKGCVTK